MKNVIRLFFILVPFALLLFACQSKNEKEKKQVSSEIPTEGVITVGGNDLEYKIEGTGTPILILNGSMYPPLFSEKLPEQCQLIYVDTRCSMPVDTSINVDSWTMDTYVDDIETIRKILGFEKVGVFSHSAFGYLPIEYALKYPERTSFIIVMGTPPYRNTLRNEEALVYWNSLASEDRKLTYQNNMKELEEKNNSGIERTAAQMYFDKYTAEVPWHWYDYNYDDSWLFENPNINMNVVSNYFKAVTEYDPSDRYDEIKCPALIAIGKYDFRSLPLRWKEVVKDLDNWTLAIFDKSSHFPMFEEQELFDSVLLKWLAEN